MNSPSTIDSTRPVGVQEPATMSTDRVFNFSAGPGVLPEPVLQQARQDIWNIFDTGIGIMEHSHRGKAFDRVLAEAEADCREVGNIPDNYRVLFLQGGASGQFSMIPMNFLRQGQTADYFDTGVWAGKAVKEAKLLGNVNVAASSAETNHDRIPAESNRNYTKDAVYCHFCSNNTIYGTQFKQAPNHPGDAPLVCDASSDIFSRPIDVTNYAMIYAGAQKNLGPAGTVLVIARDDFIEKGRGDLPTMLRYSVHAEKGSRYNTPPTFGIYLVGQVLKWIKAEGGVDAIAVRNERKAKLLYDVLDASSFYRPHAQTGSRSMMNVTFRTPSEELDAKFIADAGRHRMDGLKGHRSTGGMRASIYNSMPEAGVRALAEFMQGFETAHS